MTEANRRQGEDTKVGRYEQINSQSCYILRKHTRPTHFLSFFLTFFLTFSLSYFSFSMFFTLEVPWVGWQAGKENISIATICLSSVN